MASRSSGRVTFVPNLSTAGVGSIRPNEPGADSCKFTDADVVYGGPLVNGQAVFFEIEGTAYDRKTRNIRTDS